MIERAEIRNVGGIESAVLDFSADFIAITGESGSGKSSLVRAFELISGRRASVGSIRSGEEEASVESLWTSPDGREVITKRTLARSGKGRCFIDGAMATVAQTAEVSRGLIEIQSQFAQLDLLDASRQLEMVDCCGGDELLSVRARLSKIFPEMIELEKNISAAKRRKAELERELDGSADRVRMIKKLAPSEGCEAEWAAELASCERRLADAGRSDELARKLGGTDDEEGIEDALAGVLRELYAVAPDESRERWSDLGESALRSLQTLFSEARAALSLMPIDQIEARIAELESAIGLLRRLKRETGASSDGELAAYADRVDEGMKWLRESAESLAEMTSRANDGRAEAASLARDLRALRTRAAEKFAERVNGHLRDLAMDDSRFDVEIAKLDRVRASGAESVSFTLSSGGAPALPVSRAASGGELSRLLIAVQSSVEKERLPRSIVFDEVEAGLGGRTALLAGEKLREMSARCRVILVTHEATIAAMAGQHFLVSRDGEKTHVREISGEEREAEIARMLAGTTTPEALEHARALLRGRA